MVETPGHLGYRSEEDALQLGYVDDFGALLRAIGEAIPEDAVLYLEGGVIAPDVRSFLAELPAAGTREIGRGTIWPTPETFHVPLAALPGLRELAAGRDESDVCDHLVVYRGDEWLVWAHDAGYGHVQLARALPEETVDRFRSALGPALRSDR